MDIITLLKGEVNRADSILKRKKLAKNLCMGYNAEKDGERLERTSTDTNKAYSYFSINL